MKRKRGNWYQKKDEDQFFKNEKVWKEAGKVLESLKLEDIK